MTTTAPSLEGTAAPVVGKVILLTPAHNEERDIATTITSIQNQTQPVDRVIVVCDNCTDATAEIAESMGCEVLHSVANTEKKAGALNQALGPFLAELSDRDRILVMDADSELSPQFVQYATAALAGDEDRTERIGAISCAYVGKVIGGLLPLLQRIEYAQDRHRTGRRQGRVNCLSGVACVFTVSALRHLIRERGYAVPGFKDRPTAYLSISLTEDFEITMALKRLGYRPLAPKQCIAYTDLMPSVRMLWAQRLRWQRGTLETLCLYGFNRTTAKLILQQVLIYTLSLAAPFMFTLWGISVFVLGNGLTPSHWAFVLFPLAALDQLLSSRKMGSRVGVAAAFALAPMWLYDQCRCACYWYAIVKLLKREPFEWT